MIRLAGPKQCHAAVRRCSILSLAWGGGLGLPLHVAGSVGTTALKGDDVGPRPSRGGRAGVAGLFHEPGLGFGIAGDVAFAVAFHALGIGGFVLAEVWRRMIWRCPWRGRTGRGRRFRWTRRTAGG